MNTHSVIRAAAGFAMVVVLLGQTLVAKPSEEIVAAPPYSTESVRLTGDGGSCDPSSPGFTDDQIGDCITIQQDTLVQGVIGLGFLLPLLRGELIDPGYPTPTYYEGPLLVTRQVLTNITGYLGIDADAKGLVVDGIPTQAGEVLARALLGGDWQAEVAKLGTLLTEIPNHNFLPTQIDLAAAWQDALTMVPKVLAALGNEGVQAVLAVVDLPGYVIGEVVKLIATTTVGLVTDPANVETTARRAYLQFIGNIGIDAPDGTRGLAPTFAKILGFRAAMRTAVTPVPAPAPVAPQDVPGATAQLAVSSKVAPTVENKDDAIPEPVEVRSVPLATVSATASVKEDVVKDDPATGFVADPTSSDPDTKAEKAVKPGLLEKVADRLEKAKEKAAKVAAKKAGKASRVSASNAGDSTVRDSAAVSGRVR